jgi:hypothetical protein
MKLIIDAVSRGSGGQKDILLKFYIIQITIFANSAILRFGDQNRY